MLAVLMASKATSIFVRFDLNFHIGGHDAGTVGAVLLQLLPLGVVEVDAANGI